MCRRTRWWTSFIRMARQHHQQNLPSTFCKAFPIVVNTTSPACHSTTQELLPASYGECIAHSIKRFAQHIHIYVPSKTFAYPRAAHPYSLYHRLVYSQSSASLALDVRFSCLVLVPCHLRCWVCIGNSCAPPVDAAHIHIPTA